MVLTVYQDERNFSVILPGADPIKRIYIVRQFRANWLTVQFGVGPLKTFIPTLNNLSFSNWAIFCFKISYNLFFITPRARKFGLDFKRISLFLVSNQSSSVYESAVDKMSVQSSNKTVEEETNDGHFVSQRRHISEPIAAAGAIEKTSESDSDRQSRSRFMDYVLVHKEAGSYSKIDSSSMPLAFHKSVWNNIKSIKNPYATQSR